MATPRADGPAGWHPAHCSRGHRAWWECYVTRKVHFRSSCHRFFMEQPILVGHEWVFGINVQDPESWDLTVAPSPRARVASPCLGLLPVTWDDEQHAARGAGGRAGRQQPPQLWGAVRRRVRPQGPSQPSPRGPCSAQPASQVFPPPRLCSFTAWTPLPELQL